MLHVNSCGTTFEYQWMPNLTTLLFCFLAVNQETNLLGQGTKNIFSVVQGQMSVASGDRALLEQSLEYMKYLNYIELRM